VAIHYFSPQFVFVNAQSNIRSLKDLVEVAKKDPNFNAAYVVQHSLLLQREFFSQLGANPVMVPYQKSAQLPLSIQTGEITTFLSSGNDNEPFVKAGKIRAIGTSWDHRLSIFPDAQPMSDLVPGFKSSNQQLIAVHSDTPKHIKEYYNKVFRLAAKTEESRERWKNFSVVPGFDLDLGGVDAAIKRERTAIQNMANRADKAK
jgi:tripartite-type tricarboxylate transporter receptor subunit TctC